MEKTRLSSKGQIIIPQSIRDAHKWQAGLEFDVIDTEHGVLLTPRLPFISTSVENLIGCVNYTGRKKSLNEMQEGIKASARKRK